MALLIALLAILTQPVRPPADFTVAVARCDHAVIEPGRFVGCESNVDGETFYAGLRWRVGLVTGP